MFNKIVYISIYLFLFSVREQNTNNLALHLIDNKLKQVRSVKTSDSIWTIKYIGDEIWCCQNNGIDVYDDTLHHLRHMLGCTADASLISQGRIVIVGTSFRIVSKSGKNELL